MARSLIMPSRPSRTRHISDVPAARSKPKGSRPWDEGIVTVLQDGCCVWAVAISSWQRAGASEEQAAQPLRRAQRNGETCKSTPARYSRLAFVTLLSHRGGGGMTEDLVLTLCAGRRTPARLSWPSRLAPRGRQDVREIKEIKHGEGAAAPSSWLLGPARPAVQGLQCTRIWPPSFNIFFMVVLP